MEGKQNQQDYSTSFTEALIYLFGGVFVLYISGGGFVEIAIIIIVWLLSVSWKGFTCCGLCTKTKGGKKKHSSESDTDEDDYAN